MAQALPIGGVLSGIRYEGEGSPPPAYFVSDTVPEIYDNTIIVAATHPNIKRGDPKDDGWFLSDFYAFNYLLKGLGSSQIWLTAADPRKLLAAYPMYLHGNPFQDRKVVLNNDLLNNDELTPVTIVQPAYMIDRFLQEVRTASEIAKRQEAPLLLLVFCHGKDDFSFVLDNGNREKGISITRLKEAIEPGCRVTLVSTACHSGGWAVRKTKNPFPLNATVLSASDDVSNAWQTSRSISSRACGSVFATALIRSLTSAASPLLNHINDAQESSSLQLDQPDSLQPDEPNPLQTMTYNAFCQSILNTCRDEVHRLWYEQQFTFSAQDDAWDYSWPGRTGIPLGYFEQRWNALPTFPYDGSSDSSQTKLHLDPDPNNPYFKGDVGPSRIGGAEIMDQMTRSICQNRVTHMARLLLQTCPGDWNKGWGPCWGGTLRKTVAGEEISDDDWDMGEAIRFQWELALLADHIVQLFGLPVPNQQTCIMWDSDEWRHRARFRTPRYQTNQLEMFHHLTGHKFPPWPTKSQGPPFYRAAYYVAAAIVEADLPHDESIAKADQLLVFWEDVKQFHRDRLLKDPVVNERGRSWLSSIGRTAR
ncbi:Fc.00g071690.m01.CDS01 [Cosmosporella sp. VM-42]